MPLRKRVAKDEDILADITMKSLDQESWGGISGTHEPRVRRDQTGLAGKAVWQTVT